MKKIKAFLFAALIAIAAVSAQAATETVNGITWTYTVLSGKASVGEGSWGSPAVPQTTSGIITIPSTLGGYPVTSIGHCAFYGCKYLMSVTIPDSVTSIGEGAFLYCYDLASVTIPDSVTSIGDSAFDCCLFLMSVTIPDSVTSIGERAFFNCDSLTSVTIPDSVTSIGEAAFGGWSSLQNIIVDNDNNNYRSIEGLLFSKDGKVFIACPGAKVSVTIPDGVTSIGDSAFDCCSSLTNVTIPDSVTSIGATAFSYCSSLTSITIPNSVTSIGRYAFSDCEDLASAKVPLALKEQVENGDVFEECSNDLVVEYYCVAAFDANGGEFFDETKRYVTVGTPIGSLPVPTRDGYEFLGWFTAAEGGVQVTTDTVVTGDVVLYAQWVNSHEFLINEDGVLTEVILGDDTCVVIPDGVTSIGDYAFYNCSSLTSVTIGNSVTSIGYCAFSYCSSLTSVTIGNGVTSIGVWAFGYCSSLTSVTIGNSVTSIGSYAFYNCDSLTSVTIPDSVTSIEDKAFSSCRSLQNIIVDNDNNNYRSIEGLLVSKDGKVFIACPGAKVSVTIPDSVTSIGSYAFYWCSSLTSVTIPDSVTSIGEDAFYNCSSLTSVTIPDSVKSIEDGAFVWCSSLTSVTIGNSVTSIGYAAFYGCSGLKSVTIPDSVTSIGYAAFEFCDSLTSVTIGNGVTSIGDWAFCDCYSLTSITIPDSVTSIGDMAFYNCVSLTSITIPNSVTSIGEDAFYGCSSLTSVTIPDRVTSIGDYAFLGCSSLTSITIPDSVTSIGYYAFYRCSSLTSVTIPDSVTSIGNYAFRNCSSLTSVTIPDSVTSIGSYAFCSCYDLASVKVPLALREQVENGDVFYGCSDDLVVEYYCVAAFDANGGEFLDETKRYVTVGTRIGSLSEPTREGYEFLGWFTAAEGGTQVTVDTLVMGDMTIYAHWREKIYTPSQLFGGEWISGASGTASANGYDDSTIGSGASVRFDAESDSFAWIELEVTNSCKVVFSWKSSCEGLFKGSPYDYLSFEVDGELKEFICGESDWDEISFDVEGDGVHYLRWIFQRDAEGDGGRNCAWLADVKIARVLSVGFDAGGATGGAAPDLLEYYEDENAVLPDCGSLSWPKHTFVGWSDGNATYKPGDAYSSEGDVLLTAVWTRNELDAPVISGPETFEADFCTIEISSASGAAIHYTLDGSDPTEESSLYTGPIMVQQSTTIKAIAVRDNYFDSPVAEFIVTRGVWTFGEYLNSPEMQFVTGGDAEWTRVKGVSEDGYALRSGDITHSQSSRLTVVVNGPGTIAFKCRVEGEIAKKMVWDGLSFSIDGVQQGVLIGDEEWITKTFTVIGSGAHTLTWAYVKDEDGDGDGEDCAWLDEVVWTSDPIPELPLTATVDEVAAALAGSADAKLAENITSAADYAAYREWALGFSGATAGEIKASPYSWLSYALDVNELIATVIKDGDIVIDTVETAATDGAFGFTVKLDGIDIGEGALEANIRKVFDIEGAKDLIDSTFSAETVEINLAAPENGKIRFTVTPTGETPAKFFFKVKMK